MRTRFFCLVLLFASELTAISVWLDAGALNRNYFLTLLLRTWGPLTLRAVVSFAFLFLVFAYLRNESTLRRLLGRPAGAPFRVGLLLAHAGCLAVWMAASLVIFAHGDPGPWANTAALSFVAAGLLAIATATLAFLPISVWQELLRASRGAWGYAAAGAALVCWMAAGLHLLWAPATRATFALVRLLLTPFLAVVVSDPATATIGSRTFQVYIAPECSGLEGIGLMLVFSLVWLWLCRAEFRFPRAFLLVPASVCTAFLLNAGRIASLVLIGNAGAVNVAIGGFHSQAGWIAFNLVALGLVVGSRHARWLAQESAAAPAAQARPDNPSAVYLAPFAAILAASMISRAASGPFEWLYPLRILAVLPVFWFYRRSYRRLDWRFGWLAAAAGAGVFVFWIVLDRLLSPGAAAEVAAGHGAAWIGWLTLRVVGAVVTVPIAEELAFRGYLLRRVDSAEFENGNWRNSSPVALAVSSVAFGAMHGGRWIAGSLAGLAYALVIRRRGRIGEAIAAHAITNGLLAVWVITRGEWRLW